MNILFLIIDALCPTHLGINGYNRNTSPNIDQFAREGTIFLNSYTVLPRSDSAIASILTGLYPHNHGIRLISNKRMDDNTTTLAEILHSHGYKTSFIRSGGIPYDGSEKGFDDYNLFKWKAINKAKRAIYKTFHPNRFIGTAQQRIETAIRWIKKNQNKKFFLAMHTNDLHWPYPIPPPFDHMFDPGYSGKHDFDTLSSKKYTRGEIIFGIAKLPPEEINHAIAHYDGGVRYIDTQLKKLFDFLKEKGLYDNTLIVLSSDHGEHFGDHGFYFQHGYSVYEPSIKSTLIFHNPKKIPKGKNIESKVQVLDIMPTLLDILGIPLVDNIDGYSLLPLIEGKEENARDFIFAETAEEHIKGNKKIFFSGNKGKWRTMITGDWKIIYIPHPEKDMFELYNLKDDPEEKTNLAEIEKEKAEEMKKKILDYLKPQINEGDVKLDDLTEKSKKLLIKAGYIEED